MRNFWLLLKCDMLKLFDINKIHHDKNKGGRIKFLFVILIILIASAVVCAISASYTMLFASVLPQQKKHLTISYIYFVASTLVFFTTIGSSKVLFGSKDYNMLLGFPISNHSIILSKLAYIYFLNLYICAICLIPSSIAYYYDSSCTMQLVYLTLASILFVPLVPMTISLIAGTLVNIIMARVRHRGVIGALLAVICIMAYFLFFLKIGIGISNEQISAILESTLEYLWFFNMFADGLVGNIHLYVRFLIISIISALIYVFVLGKSFRKLNDIITSKKVSGNYRMTAQRQSSVLWTLVKKEFRQFFASTVTVMNSIGPLISVFLAALFISQGGLDRVASAINDPFIINTVKRVLTSALPYLALVFTGINSYAAYSLSIEGKSLWIVKTFPVDINKILLAKLILHCAITIPAGILTIVIYGIGFESMWYDIVISSLIVISYAVLSGLFGIYINLRFFNFHWASEVEVVKRSMSVTICIIIGLFAVVPLAAIQYFCLRISKYLGFSIVLAIIIIATVIFALLIKAQAKKQILKMQ